jgi:hypothetical protein
MSLRLRSFGSLPGNELGVGLGMDNLELKKLRRIVTLLNQAAALADEIELLADNGGYVGSIVGTVADELSLRLK